MVWYACLIAVVCMSTSHLVMAGPSEVAELADIEVRQEQLNLKKDWARYRLEKKQHECYDKFFTSHCLEQARLEHRQELKEIREQEIPMHDRERLLKSIIKDENDQGRIAKRASPEKAEKRKENVEAFEKKQAEEAKRQSDVDKKKADADKKALENKKATPF